MSVTILPTVNAVLNASAAVAMVLGFIAIRNRRIGIHRACMLTAVGLSALFLCSYVVYHRRWDRGPTRARGRSGPSTSRFS